MCERKREWVRRLAQPAGTSLSVTPSEGEREGRMPVSDLAICSPKSLNTEVKESFRQRWPPGSLPHSVTSWGSPRDTCPQGKPTVDTTAAAGPLGGLHSLQLEAARSVLAQATPHRHSTDGETETQSGYMDTRRSSGWRVVEPGLK